MLCLSFLLLVSLCSGQIQASPDDAFQRGLLALQADHLREALDAFTIAEARHPGDARIHNFRGIALMSMGKLDEAASEYRRAIELDSTMEAAFRNLGYLEWTSHHNGDARADLQRAIKLAPDDTFAMFYLARLEVDDQHPEAAIPIFRKLATGEKPQAKLNLALAYLNARDYEDAIGAGQSVTGSSPADRASAQSIIGIAEAKLRHDERSIAAFGDAAKLAPEHEEYWLNLTREQMDVKRLTDAGTSVEQGLKANPKSYALNLRRGAVYFAMGKYDEAEKTFRKLMDAGDPLPTSTIGLAQVLLHTGRTTEAATLLADAERRLGPQFLIVYFEALALDHSGKRAEALASYRRALDLNPNSIEARLGIGKTSMLLGKADDAILELQQVLKAQPGNLQARRLLSRAYAMVGDQADASRYGTQNPTIDSAPETSLVGDFILPDWQQPSAD
jgi:tetratricopeptide (TPR) repeat protein